MTQNISKLNNTELTTQFLKVLGQEKEIISHVVLYLSEIDRRKLYLDEAYSSLFTYCVEKCRYSEGAAYRRIQAARLYQKYPQILERLAEGKVNLSTLCIIANHLTPQNVQDLLSQIQYKSKQAVEKIVATLYPKTDLIPDKIRALPIKSEAAGSQSSTSLVPTTPITFISSKPREVIKPVNIHEVKIELRASESLARKIKRAKEVLRHKYPEGRLEDILSEAIDLLLEKKDPLRKAQKHAVEKVASTTSTNTRYIPKGIKHEIYRRDSGQCTYVSASGKRCQERGALEMDHIQPYALGGKTSLENLRLLCRNHNQWRSQKTFQVFPTFAAKVKLAG